ncbi:MAG TPA: PAS domain-containing protein [Pseudomonas xinjiangensis]|uniref:histidine kinase n=2 Tax=root TaxID=1 RepID=A0A7V1BPK3_9GAMM|nr:PAS domain-containing protein [Halopseudomonas xinjiangensis]HEC49518.1 PAS domain-containing protein [Halopseudomonas xinjiangensis]
MKIATARKSDSQRPRILRIYNIYRVILGFLLTVLTSAALQDGLLELKNPQLYEIASWFYLFINVLIALLLQKGRRDLHLFVLSVLDIFLLGLLFFAAGGASSGFGNLFIIPVAAGNILLHGRIGLLLAALASLVIIYLTFFLSLANPGLTQNYLQVGVLGCIFFAVALFVQRLSRELQQSEVLAQQQAVSLASLEKLNQLIIQRMRTGIMVVGPQQKVLLANEAAAQMLGRPIMREMELDGLAPDLGQLLRQWQNYPSIRPLPFQNHKGGVEIMANFKPLAKDSDETVLVFLDDNTQVAQQAQQLKLASLGRLTASIAHEIRNPLGAISHAAQLLNESPQICDQDQRLSEIIQQHSKRMNRVIETVLELSRRRPSEPQLTDLTQWIDEFVVDFQHSLPATDTLDLEKSGTGIFTRMDPDQLTQVLSNLCHNALRYSGPVGSARTIWLKLYVQSDTDLPTLEVIDQGPGVDAEHIEHIFEPFYTTEASGTGLGLYISRELCESNQARLELKNRAPKGCCMRITFAHPKRLI